MNSSVPSKPLLPRLLDIAHREMGIDTTEIDMASPLAALGDSLDFVDLLSAIEAALAIDVSNERLDGLRTVGDLAAAVQATLDERAAVAPGQA